MGEFKAGIWFALTSLYFFLFIAITTASTSFGVEEGFTLGNGSVVSNGTLEGFDVQENLYCDTPRYGYSPNGDYIEIGATTTECSLSLGAANENVCNAIQGCSWGNTTSGFWFFSSTTEGCFGDINKSYYSDTASLCTTEETSDCQILGCTVYEPKPLTEQVNSPTYFVTVVSDLFTFKYDFGFEGLTNTVLNFVLFWLPLLLWILALYFMIPFFH